MVTSDCRPEVEIWPFYTCVMQNMHYSSYLWMNHQNFCVLQEIGVEERNDDNRFQTGCRHMAVWTLWTWLWGRYHVLQNVFLVWIKLSVVTEEEFEQIGISCCSSLFTFRSCCPDVIFSNFKDATMSTCYTLVVFCKRNLSAFSFLLLFQEHST